MHQNLVTIKIQQIKMWSNVLVWFGYVTLPHVELLLKAKDYVEKKKMDIVQKRLRETEMCAKVIYYYGRNSKQCSTYRYINFHFCSNTWVERRLKNKTWDGGIEYYLIFVLIGL